MQNPKFNLREIHILCEIINDFDTSKTALQFQLCMALSFRL